MGGKILFLTIGLLIGAVLGSVFTAYIISGSCREKLYRCGIIQKRFDRARTKSQIHLVKAEQ